MFLKLLSCWTQFNTDEREVIVEIAMRLLRGQKQYGYLDLEHDDRDWLKESSEELFDNSVYLAAWVIRLRRHVQKMKEKHGDA